MKSQYGRSRDENGRPKWYVTQLRLNPELGARVKAYARDRDWSMALLLSKLVDEALRARELADSDETDMIEIRYHGQREPEYIAGLPKSKTSGHVA